MKKKWVYGLLPVACLALSACNMGKGKEPTGQVVATVDGDEITVAQLRAELVGANISDPKMRKAAEQQALQMIINRKIIAKAAEEQKIDKTPDFAVQEERAMEVLRANALEKKIIDAVPTPTREEVNRYIAANPNMFAERKIFLVDQIRMARPSDPAVLKDFEPLKSLNEVEAMLKVKNIRYQRGSDAIDVLRLDPQVTTAIINLPPNEVFIIPGGQFLIANSVRETRVVPFVGDPAVKFATDLMKNQRTREAVTKQFASLVKKAEGEIQYNKAYKPTPPAKAPAQKAAPAPKA